MRDRLTVVFLAANPIETVRLRLDEEVRMIDEAIQRGAHRDAIALVSAWAVRTRDLQAALLRHRPQIVHFSGHADTEAGIVLEADQGNPKAVSGHALAGLFKALPDAPRVVVLNACESEQMIAAFGSAVDYAIGMNKPIEDRAAIYFAAAFYGALAHGATVSTAFDLGVNQLEIEGLAAETPVLLMREGANPDEPLSVSQAAPPQQLAMTFDRSRIGQVVNSYGDGATIVNKIITRKSR